MWFMLPEGTTGISVQNHEYEQEITDADGRGYFRAHEQYAALILDLPGFKAKAPPESMNPPPDLPKADPLRDNAIGMLSAENESLKTRLRDAQSTISDLTKENTTLKRDLGEAQARLKDLEDQDKEEVKGKKS